MSSIQSLHAGRSNRLTWVSSGIVMWSSTVPPKVCRLPRWYGRKQQVGWLCWKSQRIFELRSIPLWLFSFDNTRKINLLSSRLSPISRRLRRRLTGSKSGDYEEIREKTFTKLFNNGSLLLQNVKEDREGFYICQANNGIGSGIGKVIQLKVNCMCLQCAL